MTAKPPSLGWHWQAALGLPVENRPNSLRVETLASRGLLASATLGLMSPAIAQNQPAETRIPGITVWVYEIGENLGRRPTLVEGQTPNAYGVFDQVKFDKGFDSPFGRLDDQFVGDVRGWLTIDAPGTYEFRLECDDGAALVLDGKQLLDLDDLGAFTGDVGVELAAGSHALCIPFYEDRGGFHLRLLWLPPGAKDFALVPKDNLRTEAGQTFATSPGPKRWYFANSPLAPGDGRPLEGVHPAMTLENFRGPDFKPGVGGLAFLPDGRLAVCTWDQIGAVYILDHLDRAEGVTITRFAEGLGEPLGIAIVNGDILVTQKQEVTRLRDTDNDGVADLYEPVAAAWPASHNYHEFSFNLQPHDGSLFITTSVPLKSGDTNYTPGEVSGKSASAFAVGNGPGSCWRIDPKTGAMEVFARGLRAPNGMGLGPDGILLCGDNQGDWLPASRINVLRKGGFYGHQLTPDGKEPADPPLVWLPHGEIGNSPTQMVLVPDGPYKRDVLCGDVTYGGIQRIACENVGGEWQGSVFRFSQGLEAGVNRLAWGPDGCLYVGGIGSNGNWNHKGTKYGLQRLRWNGAAPFEMKAISSRADGVVVSFTTPADAKAADPASYLVKSWRYEPTVRYGGPKVGVRPHVVKRVELSPDRTAAFLAIDDLAENSVVHVRLRDLTSATGEKPWSTEGWLTLNRRSEVRGPAFAGGPARAPRFTTRPVSAIEVVGEITSNLRHADGSVLKWKREGRDILADPAAGDTTTVESFGDCFVHVEWLSPAGGDLSNQTNGNSGVKLMGRYEIQILNTPAASYPAKFNEAGAVYRIKAADTNASTGAGTWQTYDIDFTAPRWEGTKKIANARMSVWWNGVLVHDDVEVPSKTGLSPAEAPGEFPLLLQAHNNAANGPVRFRNVWIVSNPAK